MFCCSTFQKHKPSYLVGRYGEIENAIDNLDYLNNNSNVEAAIVTPTVMPRPHANTRQIQLQNQTLKIVRTKLVAGAPYSTDRGS